MTIELSDPQMDVMESTTKITFLVGGVGCGKSRVAGYWCRERSNVPGSLGLVVATDHKQVKTATMPQLQEAWAQQGYREDVHYVIGKRPPRQWGVEAFTSLGSANILTWYWGAYIVIGGTNNFRTYRGPAFDWIYGDEVREWRDIPGTIEVFTGRLRGQAYRKAGMMSPLLLTTSPPDDPEEIEQYFAGQDVRVIRSTTFDNLHNLPPDYISSMQERYDELTYRREVLGEMLNLGGLRACYSFSSQRLPHGNVIECAFDPEAESYLTCDFNSSMKRPMSWLLVQYIKGRGPVVTIEWVNLGTNTPTQCEIVLDDLIERGFKGKLYVRGDATGEHGGRGSAATQSDYQWIERTFKTSPQSPGKWQWMGRLTKRTLRVKNRMDALNARFQTMDKRRHLWIATQCRKTIEACVKLRYLPNGVDLDDNAFNDPVSALSYWAYVEYPVHLPDPKIYRGG